MQTKISKSLESIIARVVFFLTKGSISSHLKDHLMLEILRDEGSLAYQMLSTILKDWELYQLRSQLESQLQEASESPNREGEPSVEAFFTDYLAQLKARYFVSHNVSTAHAMHDIISDKQTLSAAIFSQYSTDESTIANEMGNIYSGDDSTPQMPHITHLNFDFSSSAATSTPLLDKFGSDLTRQAKEGKIDPVVGREAEIERVVQILSRRKKNNPILIGEAGVGKSAIVEGLAIRIAQGDVPCTIRDKRLFSLDISSLVAGTKYRGEFEERMQQLLEELKSANDTIIFIDEIHTIVGAGSTQGSLDTANILKPALARGEVQTIGATTLDEYRQNIEKDSALERRFQRVIVEPTTAEQTFEILRNIAPHYEKHHKVHYTEESLRSCVYLADRYITDRFFPDKAIDIIDEAGSRAHINCAVEPPQIVELKGALESVKQERKEAVEQRSYENAALARLKEIAISERLDQLRDEFQHSLEQNPTHILPENIEQVITSITGVPIERVSSCEKSRLRTLQHELSSKVIGQDEAVEKVSKSIQRSRAGLKEEGRPIGVFMFVGPTGVGKTLLAKELSKWLFDQKRGLIRIDMSEYSEKHNVSRLIGSPPGYVGYGEGGQLTESVRRQPYSVILLDEIEKAHPEVFNTMLQIFDEGHLTDGSGRRVDFRNTVIIMTSNIGSRAAAQRIAQVGYGTQSKDEAIALTPQTEYRKSLESYFAPEFLNRVDDIIFFRSLEVDDIEKIVELEIESILKRTERLGYTVKISAKAKRHLAKMGFESRYGARSLRRTLTDTIEEPLSTLIIEERVKKGDTIKIDSSTNGIELKVAS